MKKFFDILAVLGWILGLVFAVLYAWIWTPWEEANAMTGACYHAGISNTDYVCNTGRTTPVFFSYTFSGSSIAQQIDNSTDFKISLFLSGSTWSIVSSNEEFATDNPYAIFWTDSFGTVGATGASITGAVGATGASITGPQGIAGLDSYEIAVLMGFTGSMSDWLVSLKGETGATGTLDFSTLTGVINLSNVVNVPQNDGELSSSGYYFKLLVEREGTWYVDGDGLRNLLMFLGVLIILFFLSKIALGYGKK